MRAIRLFAIAAIVLIAVYFIFRAVAANCAGAACDALIPLSLLIPFLIFVSVAIAAALATAREDRRSQWFVPLLGVTVVSVLGPVAALLIFRDNPDAFVGAGTALELLVTLTVLGSTFRVQRAAGTGSGGP